MTYEVDLLCTFEGRWNSMTFAPGLERGRLKGFRMLPTDELCEWLTNFAPSLQAIMEINKKPNVWGADRDVIGLKFIFANRGDAVLFKLSWYEV